MVFFSSFFPFVFFLPKRLRNSIGTKQNKCERKHFSPSPKNDKQSREMTVSWQEVIVFVALEMNDVSVDVGTGAPSNRQRPLKRPSGHNNNGSNDLIGWLNRRSFFLPAAWRLAQTNQLMPRPAVCRDPRFAATRGLPRPAVWPDALALERDQWDSHRLPSDRTKINRYRTKCICPVNRLCSSVSFHSNLQFPPRQNRNNEELVTRL